MTNEELIIKKLEAIEARIEPVIRKAEEIKELKEDLVPLTNQAVQLMITELQEVEAGFQLEDLFRLTKQTLRSVRNITFAMKQLDAVIEFALDLEPLLKSSVPTIIEYLDELEQRGVFRMIKAMMDVRAKVAATYDAEDIDKIGDGFVSLIGLARKMADAQAIEFIEKLAEIPASLDLSASKDIGAFGLLSACSDRQVKKGLGVLMELTKAIGELKSNGKGIGTDPS